MSVHSIIQGTSFDPETAAVLAAAFEAAWETIVRSGSFLATEERASETREKLAKRIIATASGGERDKVRLVDDALAFLTKPN
jgi:hypothetical protein